MQFKRRQGQNRSAVGASFCMAHPQGFAPFSFGDRLGLVFIVEGATLSVLAVTGLLSYIAVRVLVYSVSGFDHLPKSPLV